MSNFKNEEIIKTALHATLWRISIQRINDGQVFRYEISDKNVIKYLTQLVKSSHKLSNFGSHPIPPHLITVELILDKLSDSPLKLEVSRDCIYAIRNNQKCQIELNPVELYRQLINSTPMLTPNTAPSHKHLRQFIKAPNAKRRSLNIHNLDRRNIPVITSSIQQRNPPIPEKQDVKRRDKTKDTQFKLDE